MVVVHLAWAYVGWRFAHTRNSQQPPQVKTYGDAGAPWVRQHRNEHAVTWLTGALDMALATNQIQPVLQRFLRLPA
jgi:hypothetical protein